jgi:hypothetical protein
MVALRGFAGQVAELFDRPKTAGHDLVLEFYRRGIFTKGGRGGHEGNLGAQAHSADAILLALAFGSRELNAEKAVGVAWGAYGMPSIGMATLTIAPGDEKRVDMARMRSESVVNPFSYFGIHLAAVVHCLRRASIEGDLIGEAWKDKKRVLDSFQYGMAGLDGGEVRLVGRVQTANTFMAGECRNVVSTYCGELVQRLGKYDRGVIREYDAQILCDIADALGPLTAETWTEDEKLDYRHKKIALDPIPNSASKAFDTALKMVRGE